MSNVGVTSVTIGKNFLSTFDGGTPSPSSYTPSGKYTKLFFNYYNGTVAPTIATVNIVNFPYSFFRMANYTLITRSIAPYNNTYIKSKFSQGTFIFDESSNSVIGSNLINNSISNSTIGDLELNNILPLPSESSICFVTINHNDIDSRFSIDLKNLQYLNKASVLIELF